MTTTNPYPDVTLPAGAAHADDWADVGKPDAFRLFTGPVWDIQDGCTHSVFVSGTQLADGTVEERFIRTNVHIDDELSAQQARAIGAALIAAADDLEGRVGAMTTTEPCRGTAVDAWQDTLAGWDERVQCEFIRGPRHKPGPQCRRAAVWVGREHEHGPTVVCTQHYHRWLRATAADLAKTGYFLCGKCKGSVADRKFRSHDEAVTVHRL